MLRLLTVVSSGKSFALPVECVSEILAIHSIVDIPSEQRALRGGLNVRGGVIPLVDLRALIGAPQLLAERKQLVASLNEREHEHVEWFDALKHSVTSSVEFRKATDPRSCSFGRWDSSYKAPDAAVERTLAEFEKPHTEIHSLAQHALTLSRTGRRDEALRLIEEHQSTTLVKLLRLFADLRQTLVSDLRELAVVCRLPSGAPVAIAVDSVENIRMLEREGYGQRLGAEAIPLISRIWSTEKQTILELDISGFEAFLKHGLSSGARLDTI